MESGIIGENAVHQVASDTYLKYWCFPNPKDNSGNKNEIIDLLILFDNIAFLFEVKNYRFKGNYERYFRNTLKKAISQIQGAEKKLFESKHNINFDHPLKGNFNFIPENYSQVHRVIVNLSTVPKFYPAGTITKNNEFIHILNWNAFLHLIRELDTIPDLNEYLVKREEVFKEKQLILLTGKETEWDSHTSLEFMKYMNKFNPTEVPYVLASGNETDLLADYYFNQKNFRELFFSSDYTAMNIKLDGNWEHYLKLNEVQNKIQADKISYFIDGFIDREILFFDSDDRIEMATEILKLNRLERRIVGTNFDRFIRKYKGMSNYSMARRYGKFNSFGLSFFMHGNGIKLDSAQKMMRIALEGFCHYDKYKCNKVLMVGINEALTQTKFAYIPNVEPYTGTELEDLLFNLKTLNWFTNMKFEQKTWKEYPEE